MDTPNRELQSGTAGAGLGLALHLASFSTARHRSGLKKSEKSHDYNSMRPRDVCEGSRTTTIPQLLGASVLGDGFGALRHRVLGQLAG